MSKNKLKKFAEMETFDNVFQCSAEEAKGNAADKTAYAGQWREHVFRNPNPIVLELGCGRGEYTLGLGRLFPDKNFIGVDIKGARIWAGAKEACEARMPNVAFLRTNIEFLPRFFAADEADEIWITFPDPQMKKATKRLTSSYFMQRYRQLLRDGGLVHLKTDSPFLYQYTAEMVRANRFPVEIATNDLYAAGLTDPVLDLKTHYEKQWLERGMSIKYIAFGLPHRESYEEPDVEIEKDTYRSYGRNYNGKHTDTTK